MRPLFLTVLFAATSAFAQAEKENPGASGGATAPRPEFTENRSATQALFERLDKNRDGYLTGTELTSSEALTANWIAVDRDADGRISPAEFSTVQNGDIAITRRP